MSLQKWRLTVTVAVVSASLLLIVTWYVSCRLALVQKAVRREPKCAAAPIQLAQCRFPGLAISNAKI